MFRTFQLLAKEYLGEIRVLFGTVGGKKAPVDFSVQWLGYMSPRKGFRPQYIMVEGRHRFPVNREGEQWQWASEPPPGWVTGQGIPYDLEEAKRTRQGRPYGFEEKFWKDLKANFLRHATKEQTEFPKDFIDYEEMMGGKIATEKLERREKNKEKKRAKKAKNSSNNKRR